MKKRISKNKILSEVVLNACGVIHILCIGEGDETKNSADKIIREYKKIVRKCKTKKY